MSYQKADTVECQILTLQTPTGRSDFSFVRISNCDSKIHQKLQLDFLTSERPIGVCDVRI